MSTFLDLDQFIKNILNDMNRKATKAKSDETSKETDKANSNSMRIITEKRWENGKLVYVKENNNGNIIEKKYNEETKQLEDVNKKELPQEAEKEKVCKCGKDGKCCKHDDNLFKYEETTTVYEDPSEEIEKEKITDIAKEPGKVIIAMSGGLDSTTVAYDLLDKGYEVYGVAFKYPSHHNSLELECYNDICMQYLSSNIKFHDLGIIDLTEIFKQMTNCPFLDANSEIPEGKYNETNMKDTVVPFRNGIFASILAGLAQDNGCKYIALGIHKNDNCNYKDTTNEFFEAIGKAIKEGTDSGVEIIAPFVNSTKGEIVKRGMELKVPYHLTRSCYTGNEFSCGCCGTCNDRLDAFKEAGFEDPIVYETDCLVLVDLSNLSQTDAIENHIFEAVFECADIKIGRGVIKNNYFFFKGKPRRDDANSGYYFDMLVPTYSTKKVDLEDIEVEEIFLSDTQLKSLFKIVKMYELQNKQQQEEDAERVQRSFRSVNEIPDLPKNVSDTRKFELIFKTNLNDDLREELDRIKLFGKGGKSILSDGRFRFVGKPERDRIHRGYQFYNESNSFLSIFISDYVLDHAVKVILLEPDKNVEQQEDIKRVVEYAEYLDSSTVEKIIEQLKMQISKKER